MILRMVTAKLLAVHWARAFALMLPPGTTVNVVSPGTVLDTGAMRHAPAAMRAFFQLGGKHLMKLGGDQRPAVAAAKYLQAAAFDASVNGTFWASPPGKAIGELTPQTHAQLDDPELARATWSALVSLTGEGLTEEAAAARPA
jgi:NAD(P)-dependent dehydrogenase (short-subunit alcohol dehydrogenase family)